MACLEKHFTFSGFELLSSGMFIACLLVMAGCWSAIPGDGQDPPGLGGNQVLGEQVVAADRESSICQTGIECSHIVPVPLFDLLDGYEGNLESITYICSQTGYPMFCWKYASRSNPELREEICTFLAEHLYEQGEIRGKDPDESQEFIEGHEFDCLLGIPQFVY